MPMTIAVRFDGAAEEAVDLEVWAADNAEDAHTVAVVRALSPGESTHFGGGAAPLVSIRMLDTEEANAVARRTFQSAAPRVFKPGDLVGLCFDYCPECRAVLSENGEVFGHHLFGCSRDATAVVGA